MDYENVIKLLLEARGIKEINERLLKAQALCAKNVESVLDRYKVPLINAPTSSGKTEIMLSIYLKQVLEDNWKFAPQLIYVAPVRSLLRAMCRRFAEYACHIYRRFKVPLSVTYDHGSLWAFVNLPEYDEELVELELDNIYRKVIDSICRLVETKGLNNQEFKLPAIAKTFLAGDIVLTTLDTFIYGLLAIRTIEGYPLLPSSQIASSIVVFDEVHLIQDIGYYTFYIAMHIIKLLQDSGVPVILMSATLPNEYLKRMRDFGVEIENNVVPDELKEVRGVSIETEFRGEKILDNHGKISEGFKKLFERFIVKEVEKRNKDVLFVVNTVRRAISLYDYLKRKYNNKFDIELVHARFVEADRFRKEILFETYRREKPIKRKPLIVIATQVAECGLDYPFDMVITELAPIEAIIQRIGRIRHGGRAYIFDIPSYEPYVEFCDIITKTKDIVQKQAKLVGEASKSIIKAADILDRVFDANTVSNLIRKEEEGKFVKRWLKSFNEYFSSLNALRNPEVDVKIRLDDYITVLVIPKQTYDEIVKRLKDSSVVEIVREKDEDLKIYRSVIEAFRNGKMLNIQLRYVRGVLSQTPLAEKELNGMVIEIAGIKELREGIERYDIEERYEDTFTLKHVIVVRKTNDIRARYTYMIPENKYSREYGLVMVSDSI